MKKIVFIILLAIALTDIFIDGNTQETKSFVSQDYNEILKRGMDLFNKAYYEEAKIQFRMVIESGDAPDEDRIKAHYYTMKIHRAFGEEDKVKEEIMEILKLSPNYRLSPKEPPSLKKLFEEIREAFLKEKVQKEPSEIVLQLRQDMAVLEQKLTNTISNQEILNARSEEQEKELKKLKFTFASASITLLLLLITSAGFR